MGSFPQYRSHDYANYREGRKHLQQSRPRDCFRTYSQHGFPFRIVMSAVPNIAYRDRGKL